MIKIQRLSSDAAGRHDRVRAEFEKLRYPFLKNREIRAGCKDFCSLFLFGIETVLTTAEPFLCMRQA
jgi:hypothetical protein